MHRVFVDSNVLGSRTLYDWLFLLQGHARMYSLVVTPDVLDEAHRVWRRKHPSVGGVMRQRREELFRANFAEVLTEWTGGDAANVLDPGDRHVHNAAMSAGVDILLTSNVRDFGDPDLLPYDLYTPDDFFGLVNGSAPFAIREVTRIQVSYWQSRRARGHAVKSVAEALIDADCPGFAETVMKHLRDLSSFG